MLLSMNDWPRLLYAELADITMCWHRDWLIVEGLLKHVATQAHAPQLNRCGR